ncbi:MAG TPA: AI-2E family transporter [Euzebyales bacterium]
MQFRRRERTAAAGREADGDVVDADHGPDGGDEAEQDGNAAGRGGDAVHRRSRSRETPVPLSQRATVRVGAYAWAVVGVVVVLIILGQIIGRVSIVAIPLVLALFPAAVLTPLADRLKERGMRDALVATLLVVGTVLVISGIITVLVPVVADQIDDITEDFREGVDELRNYLARGPFGLDPFDLDELIDRAREQVQSADVVSSGTVGSVAGQAGRFLAGLIAFIIALFFYLKDGPALAAWLRRLFPSGARDDASAIGGLVWTTIGSYFRGQLLVALIDAVGITIGLLVLRVPLALPIGVLVLFGSLFPVVGAFVSGLLAVLVALATQGLVTALIVLAIVLGVQQLEGNLLQPLILGRATQLHPLAVVAALLAGGSLLGILGAFIAVPVAASAWRAISYLRWGSVA